MLIWTPQTCSQYNGSIAPSPNPLELQTWIVHFGLSEADKQILVSGGWLNANIIGAASILLKNKFPDQNGLEDTCFLSYCYKWDSNSESFIQILFVCGNHWVCVSNKICASNSVEYFDSFVTVPEDKGDIACQISSIVVTDNPTFDINVVNVHQQEGSDNCGLYALAYAFDLCFGIDPFESKYKQEAMRVHLHSCIEHEEVKPFPVVEAKHLVPRRRILATTTVTVYCHCRQPERTDMACCGQCCKWYHDTCEDIPPEIFDDDKLLWFCSVCKWILFGG